MSEAPITMIGGYVKRHKDTHKSDFKNDRKWRKLKVIYIACSLLLLGVCLVIIQAANNSVSCTPGTQATNTNDWWNNTAPNCSTAAQNGGGISAGVFVWLLVILLVGYVCLPKIYRYLNPVGERGGSDDASRHDDQ